MALAYIILAHKNPLQLQRLLISLSYDDVDFYIHIDKRVNCRQFLAITSRLNISRIFIVSSVKSMWGTFGLVEAVLNAMKIIANSNINYDNIIILSGQDYPLQNNRKIIQHFKHNPEDSHISYFECVYDANQEKWKNDIITERLGKTIIPIGKYNLRIKNDTLLLVEKALSHIYSKNRIFLAKKQPVNKFFADSQWFSLSYNAVVFIVEYVNKNPNYVEYFKRTYIPDEIFFQTILLNSEEKNIITNIVNKSLHYIDWSQSNIDHPMVFSDHNFDEIISSGKMFARKFDINVCIKVLDRIDEHRRKEDLQ